MELDLNTDVIRAATGKDNLLAVINLLQLPQSPSIRNQEAQRGAACFLMHFTEENPKYYASIIESGAVANLINLLGSPCMASYTCALNILRSLVEHETKNIAVLAEHFCEIKNAQQLINLLQSSDTENHAAFLLFQLARTLKNPQIFVTINGCLQTLVTLGHRAANLLTQQYAMQTLGFLMLTCKDVEISKQLTLAFNSTFDTHESGTIYRTMETTVKQIRRSKSK